MKSVRKNRKWCGLRSLAVAIIPLGWVSSEASGAVVINVSESAADVVAVGSGTLDTTGLTVRTELSYLSGANPAFGFLGAGVGVGNYYETISGPEAIGSGQSVPASSSTGDRLGLGNIGTWLLVPENYVSGSALSGRATWAGTTIAGLGMDPGTYLWTWGDGATADSLTLNIGVVPETSSALLLGVGAAGWAAFRRRNEARAITNR